MDSDDPVVGNSETEKLQDGVREQEHMLGRRTMKFEVLREALSKADLKNDIAADLVAEGRFAMKTVADTLGITRSNLVKRLKGRSKPRGACHKAVDAELLPAIRRLVDQRPTYDYRPIAAHLGRERRAADQPVVNAKPVGRMMAIIPC